MIGYFYGLFSREHIKSILICLLLMVFKNKMTCQQRLFKKQNKQYFIHTHVFLISHLFHNAEIQEHFVHNLTLVLVFGRLKNSGPNCIYHAKLSLKCSQTQIILHNDTASEILENSISFMCRKDLLYATDPSRASQYTI